MISMAGRVVSLLASREFGGTPRGRPLVHR